MSPRLESTTPGTEQLTPVMPAAPLVERRQRIIDYLAEAKCALQKVQDLVQEITGDEFSTVGREAKLKLGGQSHYGFLERDSLHNIMKDVDSQLWSMLLKRSGLWTFMDATARRQWDVAVEEHKTPPLTEVNIAATFTKLREDSGLMFERGVVNVFRRLSWDYKTNSPRSFGKRLILRFVVEQMCSWPHAYMSEGGCSSLDDLRRVFCVLDGSPQADYSQSLWKLSRAAQWPQSGPLEVGPTSDPRDGVYFTVKGFKNRNGHLTFTRPDLVDRMNRILAKHYSRALPPAG